MATTSHKRCFEHQSLRLDDDPGLLKALQSFYGSGKDFPYYSLIHKGVKFCEYVGVIQVGKTVIEVLPKTDKDNDQDKVSWQSILISILKIVNDLDAYASGYSSLKLKSNSILEMYFEIFIREVEYLVRTGMLRKYRINESNQVALKGRLIFAKQIQKNIVHQERFYTRNTIYDHEHIWHIILYQTIALIKKLSNSNSLHSRIGQLEFSFPQLPSKPVSAKTFTRLHYNRQTERYKKAIDIAKLLLLNYHPDIQCGRNNVLALMFDMNELWERFVYKSLRKYMSEADRLSINAQKKVPFWETERQTTPIIPDIVIKSAETKECLVWDTKWKQPKDSKPSSGDLQQMYTYAGILNSEKVALIYPGFGSDVTGRFLHTKDQEGRITCSIINIPVEQDISLWQKKIYECFMMWKCMQI